ncbi:hypothetical protein D9M69_677350 [compost metagenome]
MQRIGCGDVAPALGNGHHQLDLVVVVGCLGRVRHGGLLCGVHGCICGLHEEEWRIAVGVLAHLSGMGGVVAAHAENAVDREALVAARDAERRKLGNRNGVLHIGS